MNEPTPTNGRPFYCVACGAGFGEFLACEEPDCQLEPVERAKKSQKIAQKRMRPIRATARKISGNSARRPQKF